MTQERQIIFFDGVCNLCNGFVDFLIRRDPDHIFDYAPLQGMKARELLPEDLTKNLNSMVLWSQGQTFRQSDAVLMIVQQLGFPWMMARVGWIFPAFLRDLAYHFMAANRYRFFGRKDTCRLPTADERARFLD